MRTLGVFDHHGRRCRLSDAEHARLRPRRRRGRRLTTSAGWRSAHARRPAHSARLEVLNFVHDGTAVYWKQFGGWPKNKQVRIASATKVVVGGVMMSLVDSGAVAGRSRQQVSALPDRRQGRPTPFVS